MQLCLDVGNSHILGGVFSEKKLRVTFRHDTKQASTSDQLGLFMKTVLRENKINPEEIQQIAFCSVVPSLDYSIRSACVKYFALTPFALQAGVKTGLKIKYHNPQEVGADRIANAIAAVQQFPDQPLIIMDFGTATTCCAVTAQREYWGGAIFPGMRLAMEVLQQNTAKLFTVEIVRPVNSIGRSTRESLQSGMYHMQLGAAKELISRFQHELFPNEKPVLIATGGFSHLFALEQLFDVTIPDLVLQGLREALEMNSTVAMNRT